MRIALVIGAVFVAATAHAAVIPVTSPDPGSAVADDGQCSLPEAITAANTNTASGATPGECPAGAPDPTVDTIVLSGDVTLTAVIAGDPSAGDRGLPLVTSVITIQGGGHIVARDSTAGTPDFGIFYVDSTGDLTLNDATVTNGFSVDGGGLLNFGTLTLANSAVSDNTAVRFGGGIAGGPGSVTTVMHSTVSRNIVLGDTEKGSGGGIAVVGGAATLTVTNSTISGNTTAFFGGGIGNFGATSTVANSTISNNTAGLDGGGIQTSAGDPLIGETTFTLTGSTVSGNTANTGGGIGNAAATLFVENSTVSGNTAAEKGGGIQNSIGLVTVTGSTVSGNTADSGGGLANLHLIMQLTNTLIDDDCLALGVTTSMGGNVESPGDTCGLTDPTDQVNVTAAQLALGPLQDNGGPTMTHALLAGSPAIDAIPAAECTYDHDLDPATPEVLLARDQRGVFRGGEGNGVPPHGCDIGAYEVKPTATCGLGFELAFLLPPLMWLRGRRRRATA